MSEKKMARAKELADQLDDLFTERIQTYYALSKEDPGWLQARQWTMLVREKLWDLMDAAGISRERR